MLCSKTTAPAIDLTSEKLILFRELPAHLPKRGKKAIHLSACYRWKNHGCCGIRLETIFIAGHRYTSQEALNRFWAAVTAAKDGRAMSGPKSSERMCESASDELEAAGW